MELLRSRFARAAGARTAVLAATLVAAVGRTEDGAADSAPGPLGRFGRREALALLQVLHGTFTTRV